MNILYNVIFKYDGKDFKVSTTAVFSISDVNLTNTMHIPKIDFPPRAQMVISMKALVHKDIIVSVTIVAFVGVPISSSVPDARLSGRFP
jgi:hypothetical protein